jgi:hypothetical protein
MFGITVDPHIDLGSLLAVLLTFGGGSIAYIRTNRVNRRALERRDAKIDAVLFGTEGVNNGLVHDVRRLKTDMYDRRGGAVPAMRHHLSSLRTALAVHGIETPDH